MHKIMLLFSGMVNPAQTFNGRKRFRIKEILSRVYTKLQIFNVPIHVILFLCLRERISCNDKRLNTENAACCLNTHYHAN